jgi:hypothetical protein
VVQKVLSERTTNAVLLIVWMRGLAADDRTDAEARPSEFAADDVHQFWDSNNLLGGSVAARLGRAGLVAWDIYLGLRPGRTWDDEMPEPAAWVHQMGDPAWADDTQRALPFQLEARLREVVDAVE